MRGGWAVVAGFASALLTLGLAEGQGPPAPLLTPPVVRAELVGGTLTLDRGGSGTFRIAVEVPARHHGYLDQGDSGWLIPLTFSFSALEERGVKVSLVSRPAGIREERWRATVLRERGEFMFRMQGTGARLPAGTVVPASLRYQICDEVANFCYPPRAVEIPLRFRGGGSR